MRVYMENVCEARHTEFNFQSLRHMHKKAFSEIKNASIQSSCYRNQVLQQLRKDRRGNEFQTETRNNILSEQALAAEATRSLSP